MENKMSINVSTRSPNIQMSKTFDSHSIEGNIAKLQFASNSPLIAKPNSAISSSLSSSNGYFMRGSFKSISVNYGNYSRPSLEPNHSKLNSHTGSNRQGHQSPQFFMIGSSRNYGTHSPNIPVNSAPLRAYPQNATSPSLHSDSSSSSHTPHDESEKESDHGGSFTTNCNPNNNNNNLSTRSRITISNNCTSTINGTGKSATNGPTTVNKDNISIQISNALNNNTEMAATNCTNGIPNDNTATNTSNSIWYEYGCV